MDSWMVGWSCYIIDCLGLARGSRLGNYSLFLSLLLLILPLINLSGGNRVSFLAGGSRIRGRLACFEEDLLWDLKCEMGGRGVFPRFVL